MRLAANLRTNNEPTTALRPCRAHEQEQELVLSPSHQPEPSMPKTLANPPPANPGRPQPAGVGRPNMPRTENKARQLNGQLYYAFTAENIAARRRCAQACHAFNTAGDVTRRRRAELWRA